MDKFEELIDQLDKLPKDERETRIKEEIEPDCVCPICPTFNQCSRETGENIFCISGKSNCIETEKGCLCPTCPLALKYRLGVIHNFYCRQGSELEQREK
ncbi:MAG TPA: DUF2769 domain-containing protein [Methanobacterium sp.]|nr:DUF2769 domain-containing protein [Methanobacterium sp.]